MGETIDHPLALPPSLRRKSVVHWKSGVTEAIPKEAFRAEARLRKSGRLKDIDKLEEDTEALPDEHTNGGIEKQSRIVTFNTVGKAPVEAPKHPARLTPVRLMTPSPAPVSDTAVQDITLGKKDDPNVNLQYTPRSFSRQCHHVMKDQGKVVPFDVHSIYLDCAFFKHCSHSFVRELIRAGGPQAWHGLSVPPHVNVYQEGDIGHSMFVIGRGTAASIAPDGRIKKEYGISDCFGQIQVLGVTTRRLETIRAKTTLQVFVTTQNTLTKILKGSHLLSGITFADERRHFEKESVRIYKDFLRRRPIGKRQTVLRKGTSGRIAAEAPVERFEDRRKRLAAEKAARLEVIAAVVTGASDCLEVTQARERLFSRVASSLRTDLRRGYMMPAEHCDQADKSDGGNDSQSAQSVLRRKLRSNKELVDEEMSLLMPLSADADDEGTKIDPDIDDPLDPYLLPPLNWLSPVQKHGILRQLKQQSRGKLNHEARRGQTEKSCYLGVGSKGMPATASTSFGLTSTSIMSSSRDGETSAMESEITDTFYAKGHREAGCT